MVEGEGVTERIKLFFFSYPHSSAKQCCEMLGLNYKKYGSFCRKVKSQTKKLLEGNVQGRLHVPLRHREELRLGLVGDVVDSVEFEALKRRPGKSDPKPFDEWYVAPNRNRMMLLRNDYLTIRVFPRSGTCRILLAKPMPHDWVKVAVQNALFKAGVDLKDCEKISQTIEADTRHRIFKVGPVTPFKVDHYKPSLGLTVLADGSHPEHIETLEDWPPWVKAFITAVDALRTDLPRDMNKVASSFAESMEQHLKIIEESLKLIETFRKESDARSQAVVEAMNRVAEELSAMSKLLVTLLRRQRRRSKAKPKPKKKSRWQKFKERFR